MRKHQKSGFSEVLLCFFLVGSVLLGIACNKVPERRGPVVGGQANLGAAPTVPGGGDNLSTPAPIEASATPEASSAPEVTPTALPQTQNVTQIVGPGVVQATPASATPAVNVTPSVPTAAGTAPPRVSVRSYPNATSWSMNCASVKMTGEQAAQQLGCSKKPIQGDCQGNNVEMAQVAVTLAGIKSQVLPTLSIIVDTYAEVERCPNALFKYDKNNASKHSISRSDTTPTRFKCGRKLMTDGSVKFKVCFEDSAVAAAQDFNDHVLVFEATGTDMSFSGGFTCDNAALMELPDSECR